VEDGVPQGPALGTAVEQGPAPQPLSSEVRVAIKKHKASNPFKPTCFKSAKKPKISQFGSMDPFNFVDTVFSSQKLVQVEDSQGFSAPRPHKRRPHPVQKADGGEGGVGTIPH